MKPRVGWSTPLSVRADPDCRRMMPVSLRQANRGISSYRNAEIASGWSERRLSRGRQVSGRATQGGVVGIVLAQQQLQQRRRADRTSPRTTALIISSILRFAAICTTLCNRIGVISCSRPRLRSEVCCASLFSCTAPIGQSVAYNRDGRMHWETQTHIAVF